MYSPTRIFGGLDVNNLDQNFPGDQGGKINLLRPALFLDRDGIINQDTGYVHCVEDFVWRTGIFDLARAAHRNDHAIIVTTNQSGIGRGFYGEPEFRKLTAWMNLRFEAEGAPLTAVYFCPFHVEAKIARYRSDHPWRKPKPGMILAAAKDHGIDMESSTFVGDRNSDMVAAKSAGVGAGCLVSRSPSAAMLSYAHSVADVAAATKWYSANIGAAAGDH